MNKKALIIVLIIGGWLFFGTVKKTLAGIVVVRSVVSYDPQAGTVGGISGTYLSYDLWSYYDPWVSGELFYYDPYQYLDSDQGEGVDSSYLGFPGITVDYTTNAYQPNKFLCTFSDHRLRLLYQQPPVYFDPYQIGLIEPQSYNGEYTLQIPENYVEGSYRPLPLYPVAYTWVCILTPTVQSVSFETINSPVTAISGDSNRIFPDRDNPGDQRNMRIVRVRAQLAQAVQGIPVYFRNFDVDDPSSDSIIDPNGNTGNDNNGERDAQGNWTPQSAGTLSAISALTDANGMATVDFTVTRQPGDNFMVAASTESNYLNGVTVSGTGLQDSSGNPIQTSSGRARRTNLLTVWRRLHIEVDSMGESVENFVLGNIATTMKLRVNQTATVNINPTSPQTLIPLEHNSYEGGILTVGNISLPVTCVIANGETCNTANTVTVKNTGGTVVTLFAGNQFQLFDDDDFNNDDGASPDGDTGEDIPGPDEINATTLLQPNDTLCSQAITTNCNVFASAYIHPMYDITTDISDNTVFQSHLEENINITNVFSQDFDQIGTEASQDFWTILVYGAYQRWRLPDPFPGGLGYDADPPDTNGDGNPNGCPEASYGTTNAFAPNALGSSINMEVSRPREYPLNYQSRPVSRAWTLAHEVGHLFGGIHEDGGIMATTCTRSAITGWAFDPTTIERLRRQAKNP